MATEAKIERRTEALKPHPQASLVPAMSTVTFAAFKAVIAEHGMLVPLDVTKRGVVLDGIERLRAATELGLNKVPVRIVAPKNQLEYRAICAIHRRDLSASQRAMIVVELAEFLDARGEGKQRQLQNLRQSTEVAVLPPRGRTRTLGAEMSGACERYIQDAITVWDSDRELAAKVKEGKLAVDAAARKIRRAQRDAKIPPAPPLPTGPFELIYADPPWQLGSPDSKKSPEQHYPTMSLDAIKAIKVPAADSAFLALWAVTCLLPQAFEVIAAWGFDFKSDIIWDKQAIGLGTYARNQHETLLLARRGKFPVPDPEDRPPSVIAARSRRHSEKPKVFYELLERMYPQATKLELFARKARPGWTAWGNQVGLP
jgi:N6-adenosine-specific RNA methylase IME4